MKQEKKHSDLSRPSYGSFGRNEWSITGTTCDAIKDLAASIISALSSEYLCAYVDTKHQNDEVAEELPGMLAAGAAIDYDERRNHVLLTLDTEHKHVLQPVFSQADFVLVNGNHHSASNQVIVIDDRKKASLQKRITALTNVRLILLSGENAEPFDFVKDWLAERGDIAVFSIGELEKIVAFFRKTLFGFRPPLYGLVLAGGRSQRMGADKPTMIWHGKEQRYLLADLLKENCEAVYISCRSDQQDGINREYNTIADTFTGLGPYGAILSAFRAFPDAAWLVLASDLPLLNNATINYLVKNRDTRGVATAYAQPANGKPEPLIAIWEPKSYAVLLSFLSSGYSCPARVLQNSPVTLLQASNSEELLNVNTPADKELAKNLLDKKPANYYERGS